MPKIGEAWVSIRADDKGLSGDLDGIGATIKDNLGKIGAAAGVVAIAAGLGKIGGAWRDMTKEITVQTGATGERLEGLQRSVQNLAGKVVGNVGEIGDVISDLAAKTNLTGKPLEDLATRILALAELGIELKGADVAATFAGWAVPADQMSTALERMYRISQASGQPMDVLMGRLREFRPVLMSLGYDFDQASKLVARLPNDTLPGVEKALQQITKAHGDSGKAAANLTKAQDALNAAVKKYGPESKEAEVKTLKLKGAQDAVAQSLKPTKAAFEDYVKAVRGAATEQDAQAIGLRAFGKGFEPLVLAIRTGKFELDGLDKKMAENTNTIEGTAKSYRSVGDQVGMFTAKVGAVIGPYTKVAETGATIASGVGPVVAGIGKVVGVLTGKAAAATAATVATTAEGTATAGAGVASAAASGGFFAAAAGLWAVVAPALIAAAPFILIGVAVIALAVIFVKNFDTIKKVAGEVWQKMQVVWDAIIGVFGKVKDAVVGFVKEWGLLFLGPIGVIIKFKDEIFGFFKGAGKWLIDAGKDIVVGLVEGIINAHQFVEKAVKDLIGKVKNFVTSGFGIFSPSKVFAGYGQNMMAGLAEGLAGASGLPTAELARLRLVPPALGLPGGGFARPGGFAAAGASSAAPTVVHLDLRGAVVGVDDLTDKVAAGLDARDRRLGAALT